MCIVNWRRNKVKNSFFRQSFFTNENLIKYSNKIEYENADFELPSFGKIFIYIKVFQSYFLLQASPLKTIVNAAIAWQHCFLANNVYNHTWRGQKWRTNVAH